MRKLSREKEASRPCREETKLSLDCQMQNGPNHEKCQDFVENYKACMKIYVRFEVVFYVILIDLTI